MSAILDQIWNHSGTIAGMAGVFALAVVTPGPNFVAVTHHAVTRSRRDALAVVAGIGVASTLWIVACVLGLGLLLERAPWLRLGLQWLGAAYLIWTGLGLIRSALAAPAGPAQAPVTAPSTGFRAGLLVNLGNPKSAAFYTSLLVVMLPADPPLAIQLALPAVLVPISLAWYGTVAMALSAPPVAVAFRRAKRWLDLATGGLFTLLGLRLAADR